MITAAHAIIYSEDAEATRAFLRDKLGLSGSVDAGGGWLIFPLPPDQPEGAGCGRAWPGRAASPRGSSAREQRRPDLGRRLTAWCEPAPARSRRGAGKAAVGFGSGARDDWAEVPRRQARGFYRVAE